MLWCAAFHHRSRAVAALGVLDDEAVLGELAQVVRRGAGVELQLLRELGGRRRPLEAEQHQHPQPGGVRQRPEPRSGRCDRRGSHTANIPLQKSLCKQLLGELRGLSRLVHPRGRGYDGGMATHSAYVTPGQSFERDMDYLPDRITAQAGRSRDPHEPQPLEPPTWPVEPGRYRLVAAKACPWATRSIIVRQLLGLEDVISLGLAGPTHDERSWRSTSTPAAATRCSASSGCRRPTRAGTRRTTRGSPSRPWSRSTAGRSSPTTSRGSRTTSSSSGGSTTVPMLRTCGPTTSARRWTR